MATKETRDGVKWLARAGYATRGVLYVVIGGLAALTAFGHGGDITDSKGALLELYSQPFGQVLLVLTTIGLFGYAAFLVYRAAFDPEAEAREGIQRAKRAGWLLIAALHVGLGWFALQLLGGDRSEAGDETKSHTAELLSWPLGPWLVAAIALGMLLTSLHELWCSWRAELDQQLDLSRLRSGLRAAAVWLGRCGMAGRGLVGLVAAGGLLAAALQADPNEAKGFSESLASLRSLPFGGALFGAVALGLLAFGLYQLIEARYRRVLGSHPGQ